VSACASCAGRYRGGYLNARLALGQALGDLHALFSGHDTATTTDVGAVGAMLVWRCNEPDCMASAAMYVGDM
jgi:hypothetical protein